MTSFTFASSCGKCHPGGGALEYDRTGNRYDVFAADPENRIISGGDNSFDGDYYKARWAETGVIEADCLLCHMPQYKIDARNRQIALLNFKWAATAGAGIAEIKGSVKKGEKPIIQYRMDAFDAAGHLNVPMIKEVPTENCLSCHRETDWKKKGTSYSHRFDVHLRAGVKCTECHSAGSSASDSRINSFEDHNFAKGDDPGGLVRDDLDNTMTTCADCHAGGLHNSPIMKHAIFKDRDILANHLDSIACQTCHIPFKAVKAAHVQDSVAFDSLPRVPSKLKKIWSFYGPDVKPWNYYGEGNLTKKSGKPLFLYRPQLRWYKKKLYPVANLYSIWFGLKTPGRPGLDQVYMQDIYDMWTHVKDYPLLGRIKDDNEDGFHEINRPEEIDAAIKSMTSYLNRKGSLKNRQVVLVNGPEVYLSSQEKYTLESQPYEYSPYGSVFKLSHDIAPAGAALGAGGCTDCHSKKASFFTRPYMVKPFDTKGFMVKTPAYTVLQYSDDDLEELQMERK